MPKRLLLSLRALMVAAALLSGLPDGAAAADGAAPVPESLTVAGAILSDAQVDPKAATLDRVVAIGEDRPDATFVVLREHSSNRLLQRNNLGFFVPWDGDRASLIDNRFVPEDGVLRFKILRDDASTALYPLIVVLAYRAGETLKVGHFTVDAAP